MSMQKRLVLLALGMGVLHCGAGPRTAPKPRASNEPASPGGELFRAVSIVAGRAHVCARTAQGEVYCWGGNGSGQLGDGSRERSVHPHRVPGVEGAEALAAGDDHTCALRTKEHDVVCWGQNAHGELGDGKTDDRAMAKPVIELGAVISIAAGGHSTCARKPNGFVVCFGELQEGGRVKTPTPVFGMTQSEEIAVGAFHACARLSPPDLGIGGNGENKGGTVRCWGQNGMRQLGVPHSGDRGLPVDVQHMDSAAQVSLGHEHSCVRTRDGLAMCWGAGLRCVPGDWFEGKRASVKPGAIPGMENVIYVAAGGDQACAAKKDGSVVCARAKGPGTDRSCVSDVVPGIAGAAEIALGDGFGCARSSDGSVRCWGKNDEGQLADGTTTAHEKPVAVVVK
jgi:alpha-tubulin suppressor-like RCC1 family protein